MPSPRPDSDAPSRKVEPQPPTDQNEIFAHEWMTLHRLWQAAKHTLDPNSAEYKNIEAMFDGLPRWSSGSRGWYDLNAAEQAVGAILPEPLLTSEFQTLLAIARQRRLATLDRHEKAAAQFAVAAPGAADAAVGTPADPADPHDPAAPKPAAAADAEKAASHLKAKRAAYLALLYDLQADFINGRFRRKLRAETASRLIIVGIAILVVAGILLGVTLGVSKICSAPFDAAKASLTAASFAVLPVALCFGALGAFFSRVTRFQGELATLGFEEVMQAYTTKMLGMRLLYGVIGAAVFYFLIRSGIVGGDAFPKLAVTPAAGTDQCADLAKLLVWSFIAGFSERLVPDALERTEASAQSNDAGTKPNDPATKPPNT